jgi:hypothetical protein
MKYLLVFLAFVAISATSFAAHNDPVTATSTFDCRVITLLSWDAPQTTELEEVIAGQQRDFATAVPVIFTLSGEAGYEVKINAVAPAPVDPLNTTVSVLGSWNHTSPWVTNLSGVITTPGIGTTTITFNCTGVKSTSLLDHGSYSFTLSVDAIYNNL